MDISNVTGDLTKVVRITAAVGEDTTRIVAVITRTEADTTRIGEGTTRTEAGTTGIPDPEIVAHMVTVLRKEETIVPVVTQDLIQVADTPEEEATVLAETVIQTATTIPDLHDINRIAMFSQRHGMVLMPFFFGYHGKRHPDF